LPVELIAREDDKVWLFFVQNVSEERVGEIV
jgi:hypothetical protein